MALSPPSDPGPTQAPHLADGIGGEHRQAAVVPVLETVVEVRRGKAAARGVRTGGDAAGGAGCNRGAGDANTAGVGGLLPARGVGSQAPVVAVQWGRQREDGVRGQAQRHEEHRQAAEAELQLLAPTQRPYLGKQRLEAEGAGGHGQRQAAAQPAAARVALPLPLALSLTLQLLRGHRISEGSDLLGSGGWEVGRGEAEEG